MRPAATEHRSNAAAPSRRTSRTWPTIRASSAACASRRAGSYPKPVEISASGQLRGRRGASVGRCGGRRPRASRVAVVGADLDDRAGDGSAGDRGADRHGVGRVPVAKLWCRRSGRRSRPPVDPACSASSSVISPSSGRASSRKRRISSSEALSRSVTMSVSLDFVADAEPVEAPGSAPCRRPSPQSREPARPGPAGRPGRSDLSSEGTGPQRTGRTCQSVEVGCPRPRRGLGEPRVRS